MYVLYHVVLRYELSDVELDLSVDYVVQIRKSMDDLFFFLYVLVLLVAGRVLWLAYQ